MKRTLLSWFVRGCVKPVLSPSFSARAQRRWGRFIGRFLLGTRGTARNRHRIAGVPAILFSPTAQRPASTVLYLHGGGYVMGGEGSHGKLMARFAKAAQAQVWLPDYRLAPEHPFPAALRDALAVYAALLEQGHAPSQIALAGDSAGGGLAVATAVAIRDSGLPLPASLVLLSPWVDLSLAGASLQTHVERDCLVHPQWLQACATAYRGARPANDPGCSPLFADLRGLPPMLIQVGSEEVLLSDAERLADTATAAGVQVQLQQFDGLWHVFQLHAGVLRESDAAIAQIGHFIRQTTGPTSAWIAPDAMETAVPV